MAHRAPVIPVRPVRSTAAFRVTAARASEVVLADLAVGERVATPAGTGVDPRRRRRRRRRRPSAPTAALGASR